MSGETESYPEFDKTSQEAKKSRSVLRREALQQGKEMPTFDNIADIIYTTPNSPHSGRWSDTKGNYPDEKEYYSCYRHMRVVRERDSYLEELTKYRTRVIELEEENRRLKLRRNQMDKVYAISAGEYSDWRVLGIFTTREKAESFLKYYNESPITDRDRYSCLNPDIIEFKLDALTSKQEQGLFYYQVTMSEEGAVTDIVREAFYERDIDELTETRIEVWKAPTDPVRFNCHCWAKNDEHAIKITSDYRRQIIALGLIEQKTSKSGYLNITLNRALEEIEEY